MQQDFDMGSAIDEALSEPETPAERSEPVDAEVVIEQADTALAKSDARKDQTKAESSLALGDRGFEISTGRDLYRYAEQLTRNGMIPDSYKVQGDPQATIASVTIGLTTVLELGLPMTMGLSQTYIIGNRPAVYGDAAMSLVYRSGLVADAKEGVRGQADAMVAFCEVTRYGRGSDKMAPHRVEFSMKQAKAAGIAKGVAWNKYPDRMLLWRARHFAFRDRFPDLLMGCDWCHDLPNGSVDVIGQGGEQASGNDRLRDAIGSGDQ